jgi:hypothetical protein
MGGSCVPAFEYSIPPVPPKSRGRISTPVKFANGIPLLLLVSTMREMSWTKQE